MRYCLVMILLLVASFGIAARFDARQSIFTEAREQNASMVTLLLGDSKRMLANHFMAKADAYFHKGYYPTIFDASKTNEASHMVTTVQGSATNTTHKSEAGTHHDGDDDDDDDNFLGKPTDWIDKFGRHFFPSTHSHLEGHGEAREILPWLRISADLDPHKIETYTVASYWLRNQLGKSNEAEQFLREGWKANPDSFELLFELGRLYAENKKDTPHAVRLWELALQKWIKQKEQGKKVDNFDLEQILVYLGRYEESQGHLVEAIDYLKKAEPFSPAKEQIHAQVLELEARLKK
jgi:tetratricopeptide (TPR) repeat protein